MTVINLALGANYLEVATVLIESGALKESAFLYRYRTDAVALVGLGHCA